MLPDHFVQLKQQLGSPPNNVPGAFNSPDNLVSNTK